MAAGGLQYLGLLKTPEQAAASVAFAALAPTSVFAVRGRAPAVGRRHPQIQPAVQEVPFWSTSSTSKAAAQSTGTTSEAAASRRLSETSQEVQEDEAGTSFITSVKGVDSVEVLSTAGAPEGGDDDKTSSSGRYIEDCRLSLPSPQASSPQAASALWQVTLL
jgi:hypothetical protein